MSKNTDTAIGLPDGPPAGLSRWALPLTCLFILAGLYLQAFARGTLGVIGPDSDDLMRLLQVRDFFQGQNWFDMAQYRLGLEGGTAMHWSRIPDIPLIALTGFFNLFMPYEQAEIWAISIWPPLLSITFVLAMWQSLKAVKGPYTKIFGLMLVAFIYVRFYRFNPGAIDHHNLQLVLLAVAIGCGIDPLRRMSRYIIAGVACALSIAIGAEVYVFLAIICAYFALNWVWEGQAVKTASMGFGLGLGVTLLAVYIATIAPSAYGQIYCDTFSLIYLLAGGLGGVGVAGLAATLSDKSWTARLSGLFVLGLLCVGLFLILAPQCLSNPLSDLPPSVKALWLDQVMEAQSMRAQWGEAPAEVAFMLPLQIVALCVTLWLLKIGEDRRIFGLFLALIISGIVMSIYQSRFYAFGFLFAIIPLARWIGLMYEKKKAAEGQTSIAYIIALAFSLPYFWAFPFIIMDKPAGDSAEELSGNCHVEIAFAALDALPKGAVLATSNFGPDILDQTHHRALDGNYHRNVEGIKTSIDIFTSPPERAGELIRRHKVDYIYFCRTTRETTLFADHAPNGLMAKLLDGNAPGYLMPAGPDFGDGAVTIYKVIN